MKFRQKIYAWRGAVRHQTRTSLLWLCEFAGLSDHVNFIDYGLTVNRLVFCGEAIQF